jgi:hypothetical protein
LHIFDKCADYFVTHGAPILRRTLSVSILDKEKLSTLETRNVVRCEEERQTPITHSVANGKLHSLCVGPPTPTIFETFKRSHLQHFAVNSQEVAVCECRDTHMMLRSAAPLLEASPTGTLRMPSQIAGVVVWGRSASARYRRFCATFAMGGAGRYLRGELAKSQIPNGAESELQTD